MTQSPTSINLAPLLLRASTTHPLRTLVPCLLHALQRSGSFIRDHGALSTRAAFISFELRRQAIDETYAALVTSGLELHRDAHIALASLCIPDARPLRRGSASTLHLRLDIASRHQLHGTFFTPTLAISA